MNNCTATLKTGVSKTGKAYQCIVFTKDNKYIGTLFIKETELPYYQELFKK